MNGTIDLTYVIIIGILGLSTIVVLFFNYTLKEEKEVLQKDVDYYQSTYLKRQGGTGMYNGTMLNYNLKSFDGGKIWYACEYDEKGLIILGNVEKVYPGLLAHLEAWDKLQNYIAKFGPIDPNKITPELEKIMMDAKIKFETK